MDNRKWQANASATPPTVPASPSSGYPTNGGVSTPPTTPGEWWYYQVGEELRTVLVAAGLTPTHNLVNQLLAALSAGWGMAKSLAANGYITLPGGAILQWGSVTTNGSGLATVTFPLTFPTACFRPIAGPGNGGFVGTTINDGSITTSGFTFNAFTTNTTGAAATYKCWWLAVGN